MDNPDYGTGGNQGDLSTANATNYTDPATLNIDPNYAAPTSLVGYKPGKKERNIRRQVYFRYFQMRDNDWRTEAEHQWEIADKEFTMNELDSLRNHVLDRNGNLLDPRLTEYPRDDERSHIKLPDSFAAIQSHMQESIGRRSRPTLRAVETSDEPIEEFQNAVINYNMDSTNFDYEWYQGGLAAAIRGTAFYYDWYRLEKRWVRDVDDVDEEGKLTYTKRLITDIDDDYMRWVPNEYIYIDEKADHIDKAVDCVRREIINIREFQRIYGQKKDYFNVEFVRRGGDTSTRSIFKLPRDVTSNDVEVLHYYNRALDVHWTVANNIVVRDGPIEFKHKELPIAVRYYYRIPGQFWGMGIPQVIHMLAAERNSIRNLMVDRQNLQVNKMFIHNNLFDIDDDDLVSRPNGLISVDTNGLPIKDVLVPLEYGDIPASAIKNDQMMVEDMVRGHGIDVRLTDQPQPQTATAAALTKEVGLKRVNMIAQLDEMDTLLRIGRLKWANIQFFYPLGRMDMITEDNDERQEQVYKTVSIKGKKFQIKNENGQKVLRMEDITGASSLQLDKKMAKYLEPSVDVVIDATQFQPTSRVVQQTKVTELFSLAMGNPAVQAVTNVPRAWARVLSLNDERAEDWLSGFENDPQTSMLAAENENRVMAAGQPLSATPGATTEHTLVHIMFTRSVEYQDLVARRPEIRQLFMNHIMGEHESNTATGPAADALSANGLGGNQNGPQNGPTPPGEIGQLPNLPGLGLTSNLQQPQAQVADIQSTNFSKQSRTGV